MSSGKGSPINDLGPAFRVPYGPWAVVTGASDGKGREFARVLADVGLLAAAAGFGTSGRFVDADPAEEERMLMLAR